MNRRGLLVAVPALIAAGRARGADIPFRTWNDARGGGVAGQIVIGSVSDWVALWARVSRPAPAAFNADADVAVAMFLGERPHAGFGLRFERAEDQLGEIVLQWREVLPDPMATYAQAVVNPWAVALVRAEGRPVRLNQIAPALGP